MKNLLKIISLSLLVSISLFANVQEIDECKVDLYYANGIMIDMNVTQAKHEKKWKKIVYDMFISNPEEYKKIANARISYNASQGFFDDVFESAEQVMSNEWGWKKFSIFFRTYLETHNIQKAYDTHIPDLTAQVKTYKDSIKLGHGVIVIAHSQGNYYTNEAYEKLDAWMQDYFHMFGVATPANHVAGFPVDDAAAPYVKFHNDFINSIVTALPSNLDDTRHHGFPSIDAHDFYESYMKEETSKKMITDFIIDEIQKHSKNDSQWELDKELNKGTKDYKITLKHRFDTTITSMQDVEVYPFNASKKLYHVIDNTGGNGWVKANCGGEEVFDYWDGKKDSEVYKLKETNELITLTKLKYDVVRFLFIGILKDGRGWSEREINGVSMVLIGSIDNNRTYTDDTFISAQSSSIDTIIEGSYYNNYSVYTGYSISKPLSIGRTRVLFETSDIEELKNLVDKGIPLFSTRFNFTQDMFNKLLL